MIQDKKNILIVVLAISFTLLAGGVGYLVFQYQSLKRVMYTIGPRDRVRNGTDQAWAEATRANPVVSPKENMWLNIQKKVKDTVVQVYSQCAEFNWLEPYKSPSQSGGVGSGFFVNKDGDIITNYHVVAEASSVQIQIPTFGKEQFDVEIVGASPERDIALLKLTSISKKKILARLKTIPFLKLGDSDLVLRSKEVLALGYPLGQTRLKSTLGIVSGRETLGYFGYIQITAPLNPGNSGGPALNSEGEVIGINSRGIPSAQNVGYIIPINEVKTALKDLYKVRLLRKPMLGCMFTPATTDMVEYLGNPPEGGWCISKVFEGTLLDSVGIKDEDMLYEVNGYKMDMYGELDVPWSEDKVSIFELLNRYKVGDKITFLIYRSGKPKTFTFALEHKYLPRIRMIYPEFEPEAKDYEIIGGLVVMELTFNHIGMLLGRSPNLVKYTKPDEQHDPALIITHVLPNSQADRAHTLTPGKIIEKINGQPVTSLEEFRRAVLKSRETGFIRISEDDNFNAVLSVEKIVRDEDMLSTLYFYKKSSLVEALSVGYEVNPTQAGPEEIKKVPKIPVKQLACAATKTSTLEKLSKHAGAV